MRNEKLEMRNPSAVAPSLLGSSISPRSMGGSKGGHTPPSRDCVPAGIRACGSGEDACRRDANRSERDHVPLAL